MKISPDNLAALRAIVAPLDTPERRDYYRSGAVVAVKSIDRRYRWDLFHGSGPGRWPLIDGLDDAHIDTALRAIVPSLGKGQPAQR